MFSRIHRTSDVARNTFGVVRSGEREDEDEMKVIDFGDLGRERAGVDDTLHPGARCTHRRVRQRLAQLQMVDDDVHDRTLPRRGSTTGGAQRRRATDDLDTRSDRFVHRPGSLARRWPDVALRRGQRRSRGLDAHWCTPSARVVDEDSRNEPGCRRRPAVRLRPKRRPRHLPAEQWQELSTLAAGGTLEQRRGADGRIALPEGDANQHALTGVLDLPSGLARRRPYVTLLKLSNGRFRPGARR